MIVFDDPCFAVSRIRAEYREMPGLSLTREQAARLLGLDGLRVMAALDKLRHEGFLARTSAGRFVRRDTNLCRAPSAAGVPRIQGHTVKAGPGETWP